MTRLDEALADPVGYVATTFVPSWLRDRPTVDRLRYHLSSAGQGNDGITTVGDRRGATIRAAFSGPDLAFVSWTDVARRLNPDQPSLFG